MATLNMRITLRPVDGSRELLCFIGTLVPSSASMKGAIKIEVHVVGNERYFVF